jgi:predicted aspartyl protease
MWRSAAMAILLSGLLLGRVMASEAVSPPAPNAPPELGSPYQQYDLKLRAFYPAPRCPAGVLLHVRINGGTPLRLLLDSAAELIVVGTKAAHPLGLSAESELELVGLGGRLARVGRAQTVEIGPVSFRNCRVAMVEGRVIEGADGVIPLSLFSAFLLRLDLPEKTLGLIPYPREESLAVPPRRGLTKHDLLLVPTVLNGKQSGYVFLDTGAYCSAISREAARTLGGSQVVPEVPLAAGTGTAIGRRVSSRVHFAIATQDLTLDEVVAIDLSNLSRHCGVEVMGVLGYPALSKYVLTIDYRGGQVKIEPQQINSARELHCAYNAKTPAALSFH